MTDDISQSLTDSISLPENEAKRLEALRRYNVLDTPPEAAFDRVTSLAARLFQMPTVLVSLVDESRAWFKSCYGFNQQEVPRHDSICNLALLANDVLVIPDARQDDRFACNPFVQNEPTLRFYAGAPLITQDGFNLGTLCLLDTTPRDALTQEQLEILTDLAAIVVDELELRLAVAKQVTAERERQEAAQHLQLYADVVSNTQVGLVVWQLEDVNDPGSFRLLIANPAASEATGLDFASLVGKTMAEGFPKLLQTPLVQQYVEVIRTGQSLDLGEIVYSEDGVSTGIYSLKAFPLPNRCIGFAFENITARKQIESQLQESQHYNQQIAEAVPGVLFVHDLIQQQNVYTNRQITDLLGYTSEEVRAMGANALEILVHPDDLARIFNYVENFRFASDNQVFSIEYQARHANGEGRWIYTQSVVFNRTADGLPRQVLGVSLDITQRKQIEQALRESEKWAQLAIQVAQLGGWRLHLDTNLVEVDERMRQIWGEPNGAVLIPLPAVIERIHPDDRERVAQAVSAAIDPQSSGSYETEYRIIWNNGSERWVLAKGQAQFEGEGESRRTIAFFGTGLDITERKQTEAALTVQEQRYRYIFEAVSVAIWEEDFSEVKAAIDQLKTMGIQDFQQYFTEHPEFVQQMAELVQVQDVNQAAVQMFGAPNKTELLSSLTQIFVPETTAAFIGELLAIANKERSFAAETVLQTLQGDRLDVWFTITFPPESDRYDHVLVSLLDITQRKRSELEQERSEAILNAFLAASPIALTLFDQDLRYLYANEALAQINGLPLHEHLGRTLPDVVPDMAPQFAPMLRRIMQTQEPVLNLEYSGEVRPGVYCHTIANHFPVCLPNGEVLGVGITITDISELHRVEAELRQSEERLSLALSAANQGLYDLNVQTGDAIVSPEYARMLGYEPEEFQETNAQWRDRLHPDDVATVYRVYEDYLAGHHNEYRVEFRQRTQAGGWIWILSVGKVVTWDQDGKPLRMLGTHTDISDRKQAEQALQQHSQRLYLLYETSRDLLAAKQPMDLMHQLFSRLSVQMDLHYYYHFEVSEQDGRQRLQLISYSGLSEAQAQAFESIDLGQAMCGLVAQERQQIVLNRAEIASHPNARILCSMEVTAYAGQPLMVQGRLLGTLSFASLTRTQFTIEEADLLQVISEQVAIALERAELVASLEQQAEELRQANRVKDEFLAVLSHELRSPLNPILGWTKLLQTGRFDAQKTKQALEIIERNVRQQTQLIDDLLDISKILRGKLVLNEAPVDLACTIESALETMRLAGEAKSIQTQINLDSSIPPVLGDAGRLQQVVLNLLSNAIKFTPNGGQVKVQLERVGDEAQIQVKDTGKGITPDFLPYVFESFRQEDGRTTRKFGGLGLGLAIVRQLTELHGGTVRAESPGEGAGATFTIRLPLMKTPALSFADETSANLASSEASILQGIRILVVDDEADMRDLLVAILEPTGAIVQVATSASEALAVFAHFQPMLLVSDIGMPETDGYELMQQVKSRFGELPAIALTAYAMEQDQQKAFNAGFQRHIAKPIDPAVLVKAISALISEAR
ncbi:PAS domain-containing protein [Trichocoleus sp. FACHB-591]|uniref:PAS domain-containing protein n=1 Tax=Trichocoleus sp. FACHB-591 TaxID=2692872 RepID=UPI001686FF4E|nr:PAS domain-containing protein [Trichocoleus sp. FACHB-591]MBD2093730.1 PAS domain-containing protein [Trichocoleus sp. FACHB-591]